MAYCSSLQPVVVYNFWEIQSTFSVPFLKLRGPLLIACGMVSICLIRKYKYDWFFSTKDFFICLFFFYICCTLSFVHNILPRQQIVWKHFRIFVTVTRSKFHPLLKFSTRGTLKIIFCHVAFYFHGLICWRLTVSQ